MNVMHTVVEHPLHQSCLKSCIVARVGTRLMHSEVLCVRSGCGHIVWSIGYRANLHVSRIDKLPTIFMASLSVLLSKSLSAGFVQQLTNVHGDGLTTKHRFRLLPT
jgi:hypothetical protein